MRPADRVPRPVIDLAIEGWDRCAKQHIVPVSGRSMLPLLHDGDRVLVAHGERAPRWSEIIVFRQGDRLVVHRLLGRHSGPAGVFFLTKGDNAAACDPLVAASNVVGRVVAFERDGRRSRLDTGVGIAFGWLVAAAGLVVQVAYRRGRRLKRWLLGSTQ